MKEEAALLKTLSDPTRLKLAVLLAVNGETCVCILAEALGAPDFRISRHLAVMRAAGMVAARREGTWMHYRLTDPRTDLEKCLRNCFRRSLAGRGEIKSIVRRLARACCAP